MAMCSPPGCGPTFSFEAGGRATLALSTIWHETEGSSKINFQRDLYFKDVLALGEVYAAVRIAPRIAFTYTFIIPTEDEDTGFITAPLQVGNVLFPANSIINWKTTTSVHRWEGEYFFLTGCNYRIGGYGLGELIVDDLRFTDTLGNQADRSDTKFLLGFGGSAEYGFSDNMFLRAKGAYTFLEDTTYGIYAEVSGRMFPDTNNGCQPQSACGSSDLFSGWRPYGEIGYRYRVVEWDRGNNNQGQSQKLFTQFHGPFAALGAIF